MYLRHEAYVYLVYSRCLSRSFARMGPQDCRSRRVRDKLNEAFDE